MTQQRYLKSLVCTALLFAATCTRTVTAGAGTQAASRRLLQDGYTEASGHNQAQPTQGMLELFQSMVDNAQRIYEESKDETAVALQLRAAFQMCPTCPADNTHGTITQPVFYLDGYKDRTFMAQNIMPAIFAEEDIKTLLWVGIQPYTLRYEYIMKEHGIEMTTIEVDPNQAKYGSSSRHIVDPVQNVHEHVEPESFDAVIINGVIGWGVNSDAQIKHALKAMHRVLRPNGLLVVGYNAGMVSCCDQFNPLFRPAQLGGMQQTVDMSDSEMHHVYEFFRKETNDPFMKEPKSLTHHKSRYERRR